MPGERIRVQSVRNLGFIKQLDFIALYFDTFTLGKSRDLNSKQFQQTIRKLCGLEPRENIIQ